jgi:hypothetical protein
LIFFKNLYFFYLKVAVWISRHNRRAPPHGIMNFTGEVPAEAKFAIWPNPQSAVC